MLGRPLTASIGQKHIDHLWYRMAGIFGHKWVSSYGETPSDTWLAALSHLSPDQLLEGILRCLRWPDKWPPTLPEFIELCEQGKKEFYVAKVEDPDVVAARKASGLRQLSVVRDELAYTEWGLKHGKRSTSIFTGMMQEMFARHVAACQLGEVPLFRSVAVLRIVGRYV